MSTTIDNILYLKQARDLLAQPYGWVKGALSKQKYTRKGEHVTGYCAIGALNHVCGGNRHHIFNLEMDLEETLQIKGFFQTVYVYNDVICKKKSNILSLIDETIARLETKTAA